VRRFDPYGAEPLIRFQLHRTGPHACSVFVSFHHALLDGWSGIELRNALFQHYLAARSKSVVTERAKPSDVYREFVVLEQETLNAGPARRFWRTEMRGENARAALARGKLAFAGNKQTRHVTIEREFPAAVGAHVADYAQRRGVSVKAVFLSAVCQALIEVFGLSQLVTAVVTNGRSEHLTDPLRPTGLFWNIVPFVTSATSARSTVSTQQRLDLIAPHGSFPLREIETDLLGGPLVAPIFNFVNFHNTNAGARRFTEGVVQSRFHFPLTFFIKFTNNSLEDKARMRIDADPAVHTGKKLENLWSSVNDFVDNTMRGSR
jgi:hypothetical protein